MKKITTTFLILMALSSCGDVEGSNPFGEREPTNNETDADGKFGVEIFGIDQSENGTVEGYFAGEIPTESVGVLRLTGARLC